MDNQEEDPVRGICVDEGRGLARQVSGIFGDKITLAYERGLEEVVDRFEREAFDVMLFSSSVAPGLRDMRSNWRSEIAS